MHEKALAKDKSEDAADTSKVPLYFQFEGSQPNLAGMKTETTRVLEQVAFTEAQTCSVVKISKREYITYGDLDGLVICRVLFAVIGKNTLLLRNTLLLKPIVK